jgi:cobalt-zinc-cadmium efflux system membrane fusion protein
MNLRVLWPAARLGRHANALTTVLLVAGLGLLLAGMQLGWVDLLPHGGEGYDLKGEAPAAPANEVELTPEKLAAAGIELATVVRQPIAPTRLVPGEVTYDAARRVPVTAPVAGVVLQVLVEPSQSVEQGTPLAILSSPEVGLARNEVLQREAELALVRREQERAEAVAENVQSLLTLLSQRPKLADVEAALEGRMLGEYREKLVAAYSRLLAAERASQAGDVLGEGTLSRRLLEERLSVKEQAAAQFQGACEAARFAALQERDRARAAAQQAQRLLAVAQQTLANLLGPWSDMTPVTDQEHLSELKLLAPLAGRVEERLAVATSRVQAGQTLFVVADTRTMWISAEIHERDWPSLELVREGETLPVQLPALASEPLHATVRFIGSQIAPEKRAVPLVLALDNAHGRLKPGMFAWVQIPLAAPREALVVPAAAIQRHENQPMVFVPVGPRTFRRVEVDVGIEAGDRVEIRQGLKEGDPVVARGAFFLKSELLLEREAE